jgi:outer membrane protein
MFQKFGIRLLAASMALLAGASVGSAQVKVAIVDVQRAVFESAEIKKASAAMEAKYKPRQAEIDRITKEIQALQQQIQSGKLSALGEQDANMQGQKKQRELTRLTEDLQADVDRERNDTLSKASERMKEVVKKLAEEKGVDVVMDVTNAFYFKPALEITTEAITAYDKAYPAK